MPDGQHAAANTFVRRVGSEAVQKLSQSIHAELRRELGYKRLDFDFREEDGYISLMTPGFDLEIRIDQCPDDPKAYLLETRLTRLRDPKLAQNPAFLRIFSPLCNRLHVYLRKPIDLAAKIDALEAIPEITEGLSYPPDASSFELRIPSLDCVLNANENELNFQLLTLPNLEKLLQHSERILEILTQAGFELRLGDE